MLYGRRLDQSLAHVDGSRYALVHAVAKRARQITLWLTADPAELRAEAAPPPAPGELTSRDPVALAEVEILDGEVIVRWDPEGVADERLLSEEVETDPLLMEGITADDELERLGDEEIGAVTPALAQVLEGEEQAGGAPALATSDEGGEAERGAGVADDEALDSDSATALALGGADDLEEVSLEEVGATEEAGAEEDEEG